MEQWVEWWSGVVEWSGGGEGWSGEWEEVGVVWWFCVSGLVWSGGPPGI